MPDDAFILVRNWVHCHLSTETEAQVTRCFATGSAGLMEFGNEAEPGLSPAPSLHTNITALDETSPQQK